ncbi:hypothetical protein BH18GEM1_BH18GEM1_23120 [soil metagenome]
MIGFEDQSDCFLQVCSHLLENRALGVCARKLFHERDIVFRNPLEDGGEGQLHVTSFRCVHVGLLMSSSSSLAVPSFLEGRVFLLRQNRNLPLQLVAEAILLHFEGVLGLEVQPEPL